MTVTTQHPDIRIELAADGSEARLTVPVEVDRLRLTAEHCLARVQAAGVELTEPVQQRVKQVIYRAQRMDWSEAVTAVIASGTAAVDGTDGWVQWYVDQQHEPGPGFGGDDDDETGVCHYSRSAFTLAEAGEVIGHVHEPTAGRPGRDVTGAVLEAHDGEPAALALDDSVHLAPDGALIAQVGGVLVREGPRVAIDPALRIETDVDFSTGNVAFDGDVIIMGGVCDRFLVRSDGRVEVHGVIEAATIETAGDLHARGGFAGRERGTAYVGGDLHARYLNNVRGSVFGDLVCEREIINCDLVVHGRVRADGGAIIDGRLNVTGPVDVGLLGAPAGTLTELIVGRVPRLEPLAAKLHQRITQIKRRQARVQKQVRQLRYSLNGPRLSDDEREQRLAELEAELNVLGRTQEKAEHALAHLHQVIEQQRTVHINIERRLSPGVVLIVGQQRFQLQSELVGPVEIRRHKQGRVIYRQGHGEARPLETIAKVDEVEASVESDDPQTDASHESTDQGDRASR